MKSESLGASYLKKSPLDRVMISKSGLAIELSKLEVFKEPKVKLEQYPTDSEVAADLLWNAYLLGDIEDRNIADMGCGTGILGVGALLLGAKHVTFIDKDEGALETTRKNLDTHGLKDHSILRSDIDDIDGRFDTVVQNPPFGIKQRNADRPFLIKAFSLADTIFSLHSAKSETFLEKISADEGFIITHRFRYKFPLKRTQRYHKKDLQRVDVIGIRAVKDRLH